MRSVIAGTAKHSSDGRHDHAPSVTQLLRGEGKSGNLLRRSFSLLGNCVLLLQHHSRPLTHTHSRTPQAIFYSLYILCSSSPAIIRSTINCKSITRALFAPRTASSPEASTTNCLGERSIGTNVVLLRRSHIMRCSLKFLPICWQRTQFRYSFCWCEATTEPLWMGSSANHHHCHKIVVMVENRGVCHY